CARSSARPTSPTVRVRVATIRAASIRQTASTVWRRSSAGTSPILPSMPSLPDELATRVERLLAHGQRVLLGITGPPGGGKSTLAAEIVDHVGADAVGVPMDGFHLAD